MLLASNSCRPSVRLPAGSMSSGWSKSSSAAAATWLERCCVSNKTRSISLEMAQEKTPLSLANIESWWSKLLSVSRMDRPRSRWTAAIACERLLPILCSCPTDRKSIGKWNEFIENSILGVYNGYRWMLERSYWFFLFIDRKWIFVYIYMYLGGWRAVGFAVVVLVTVILSADLIQRWISFQ